VIATAGAMFKPRLLENYEMEQLQERVHFDRDIAYTDVKAFLIDRAHEVAFRKGMGNPVICSEANEGKVEAGQIFDHFQKSFIRQGSSAVSYGVDPSFFEELLARNFSDVHFSRFGTIPQIPPKYFGGEARYDRNYNNNVALLAYPSKGGVSNLQHLLLTKIIMQVLSPVPSVKYGNALTQLASGAEFLSQFQEHHSDTSLIGFFIGGNQIKDPLKSLRHNLGTVDTLISEEQFEAAKSKVVFDLMSATENRASYLQQTSEKVTIGDQLNN
jgi:ubiquinol-cytochrome c reductase core subunit 2